MRWYTYKIIDPRDASVFYVGKGTGRRAESHLSCKLDHPKNHRIAEIRSQGYEPVVERVAYFWEEQHALDHEAELIAGHKGLTNIAQNDRPVRYIGLLEVIGDLWRGAIRPSRAASLIEAFINLGADADYKRLCEAHIRLINHPVMSKKLWPAQ